MSKVIDNPFAAVYEGDALTTLRTLADDSVDCCVTSPPYWGLRDYGTGTWEGGSDECNHKNDLNARVDRPKGLLHSPESVDKMQQIFNGLCGKCGATRIDQQMGLEPSPFEYIDKMAGVFDEVRRVLKPSGTCWLVIGDSYAGGGKGSGGQIGKQAGENAIKPKDLCGIPWRLAFALQERGWYLRQDIIWAKPNPMPESVTDRCTRSHEYVFMLTKCAGYAYDGEAISTPIYEASLDRYNRGWNGNEQKGRTGSRVDNFNGYFGNAQALSTTTVNRRDVWQIITEPFADAHFATFPTKLVELCIKAGCPADGVVLDPFGGCGTTGEVAVKLGRRAILIELNPQYVEMIRKNLGLFAMAAQ